MWYASFPTVWLTGSKFNIPNLLAILLARLVKINAQQVLKKPGLNKTASVFGPKKRVMGLERYYDCWGVQFLYVGVDNWPKVLAWQAVCTIGAWISSESLLDKSPMGRKTSVESWWRLQLIRRGSGGSFTHSYALYYLL